MGRWAPSRYGNHLNPLAFHDRILEIQNYV